MAELNKDFIITLQGKDYVTYNGLIDLAHQMGLQSLEVEVLQIPTSENGMIAICKATAKTKDKYFIDIGDASSGSVSRMLTPHIMRMASTRAKARALRDLTNVGMTAIEELAEEDKPAANPKARPQLVPEAAQAAQGPQAPPEAPTGPNKATEKQLEFIYKLVDSKNYIESITGYIEKQYGKNKSTDLTTKEAAELIGFLKKM